MSYLASSDALLSGGGALSPHQLDPNQWQPAAGSPPSMPPPSLITTSQPAAYIIPPAAQATHAASGRVPNSIPPSVPSVVVPPTHPAAHSMPLSTLILNHDISQLQQLCTVSGPTTAFLYQPSSSQAAPPGFSTQDDTDSPRVRSSSALAPILVSSNKAAAFEQLLTPSGPLSACPSGALAGPQGSAASLQLQGLTASLQLQGPAASLQLSGSAASLRLQGRDSVISSAASTSSSTMSVPGAARQLRGESSGCISAGSEGHAGAGVEEPLLARELGVTMESMARLFRVDGRHAFEQPVWMVVNLQVWARVDDVRGRMMRVTGRRARMDGVHACAIWVCSVLGGRLTVCMCVGLGWGRGLQRACTKKRMWWL